MAIGRDIYGAQRMNHNNFGDPVTFTLAPPAAQSITVIALVTP